MSFFLGKCVPTQKNTSIKFLKMDGGEEGENLYE